MSFRRTIFILGAGSSVPYGLPTGGQLKTQILKKIFGSEPKAYLAAGFTWDQINEFGEAFSLSQVETIDFFLDQKGNEYFSEIGKFAIAHEITYCEKFDNLMGIQRHEGNDFSRNEESRSLMHGWYSFLWQKMKRNLKEWEENEQYIFITFNYDRSLEHFFYTAFKSLNSKAGLTDKGIRDFLEIIRIVHVHGRIAPLPWEAKAGEAARYGEGDVKKLRGLLGNIKLISESHENDSAFKEARSLLGDAPSTRIIFLGFGFHPENMRRLGFNVLKASGSQWKWNFEEVHATRLGLSDNDIAKAQELMSLQFTQALNVDSLKLLNLIL